MDYDLFMPHINLKDGVTRVLNNEKLYLSLVKRFKGRAMTDTLLGAIESGDSNDVIQAAHALKGTAANLGFPVVYKITEDIETLAKAGEPCTDDLRDKLQEAIDNLEQALAKLYAE